MKKYLQYIVILLSLFAFIKVKAGTNNTLSVQSVQVIDNQHGNLGNVLSAGDRFGDRIRNIGDLDGDGINDMVVGADFDSTGGSSNGAIYILFMKKDGTIKSKKKITSGSFGYTFPSGYRFGQAVACIGDLDGDGVQDLAVTAIAANNYQGAVLILFMNRDGSVKGFSVIDSYATNFSGVLSDGDLFGLDVAGMGDINGDSINDIAVGAIGDNSGGIAYGAAYVIFLNKSGGVKGYQKICDTSGNFKGNFSNNDGFGVSVNNVGDINGDGINDLAIGAAQDNDDGNTTGAVFIARLSSSGKVKSYTKLSNMQTAMNSGIIAYSEFGMSESITGDINGDGIKDMVVGAEYDSTGGYQTGAAYIVYLDDSANVKYYQYISNNSSGMKGILQSGGRFGVSVTDFGNLASDSTETIAIGNSWSSDSMSPEAGSVLMINFSGIPVHKTLTTLVGHISQSNGNALKSCKVYLLVYDAADSTLTTKDSTTTDSTGFYKFITKDSMVLLYVFPDSNSYPGQMPTYYDSTLTVQLASAITIHSGTNTVNFKTISGTNPGGTGIISGKITLCFCKKAGPGQPVEGLKVILMDGNKPVEYTFTDKNGDFVFKRLGMVNYKVFVDYPHIDNSLAPEIDIKTTHTEYLNLNFTLYTTMLKLDLQSSINTNATYQNTLGISPNPFSENTVLSYKLNKNDNVDIRIYDISGKEAGVVVSGIQAAGAYSLQINKKDYYMSSGVYFVRYMIGSETATMKIINAK